MTYHRVCNKNNTTDITRGTGTAYRSGASESTPVKVDAWLSFACLTTKNEYVKKQSEHFKSL
jgi:hypothetical protein